MTYQVQLLPSGHVYALGADEPILRAGLAAGMSMPYSCRTGVCNTCRGRIVEGEVDHGFVLDQYLSPEDRAQGYALLCSARARSDLTIEVRELIGIAAVQPKQYPCRVVSIERPAPDVAVLRLRMPLNENMTAMAGQYVEVLLPDGQRRNYSIGTAPDPEGLTHIELHVRHVDGGRFTDHVFSDMQERDLLRFEGPYGTFFIRDDSEKPVVLLASGTGFAPIKAMIEHALRKGSTRPMTLYWGGRTRRDLYMMDLAERWASEHGHIRFVPVLSAPGPECEWSGRTGFVHRAVVEDLPDLSAHQVYACGAPVVVDAAKSEFIDQCGLAREDFFADSFVTGAERAGVEADAQHPAEQRAATAGPGSATVGVKNQNAVIKPYVLSHGTLECRSLADSRRFYEEFLGLECVRHAMPAMAVRCGMKFHIFCVEVGDGLKPTSLLHHWGVDVGSRDEVDAAHRAALDRKDEFRMHQVTDVALQHGVYSFYIEDLDRNWWEVQHYDGFQHDDVFDFGDRFPM